MWQCFFYLRNDTPPARSYFQWTLMVTSSFCRLWTHQFRIAFCPFITSIMRSLTIINKLTIDQVILELFWNLNQSGILVYRSCKIYWTETVFECFRHNVITSVHTPTKWCGIQGNSCIRTGPEREEGLHRTLILPRFSHWNPKRFLLVGQCCDSCEMLNVLSFRS